MLAPRIVRGVSVPAFFYGTAWKEDATENLVLKALDAGFRAIDTANQRKHYFEEGVGRALQAAVLPRDDLFIQTKFTYPRGQDHRLPYDPNASVADEQVRQSFASSLEHLGLERIDSLVLHGPSSAHGIDQTDREAWATMESLLDAGRVRLLGISNVSANQLAELIEVVSHAPAFVQNRCYASRGWDRATREVCAANDVVYQGFSLLTANRQTLASGVTQAIAKRHGRSVPQVIFRFAHQLGMIPLTGTSDAEHMTRDLAIDEFELSDEEVEELKKPS